MGKKDNMEKYNSDQPPIYDLKKLSLPQTMIVGGRDILATPEVGIFFSFVSFLEDSLFFFN